MALYKHMGDELGPFTNPYSLPIGILYRDAIEFIMAYDVKFTTETDLDRIKSWIDEEMQELKDASNAVERLDALIDILYLMIQFDIAKGLIGDVPIYDFWAEMAMRNKEDFGDEFDFLGAWHEVHRSNMSKLGDDGKPIYREEDGKVMKGPNYFKPNLVPFVLTEFA